MSATDKLGFVVFFIGTHQTTIITITVSGLLTSLTLNFIEALLAKAIAN